MNRFFLSATAAMALVLCSAAAQAHPTVVELFTSEGCSSCPPAEAYLGELAQRPDVLALSFHVDYWDGLGWHDRFSLASATARQRSYASALGLPTVFTPQVVIDGREDFVGSDRRAIGPQLGKRSADVPVTLGLRDGNLQIDVSAQAGAPASEVILVAYQHEAVTAIGRGENAGRTVTEHNVVREFRSIGQWRGQGNHYQWNIASLPATATHVAVLVQPDGHAPILGAASLALR